MHPNHMQQISIWFIKGSVCGFLFGNSKIKASQFLGIDNNEISTVHTSQQ